MTCIRKLFILCSSWLFLCPLCCTHVRAQSMSISNGLKLWLKADAGVITNIDGSVTKWMDQISTNDAIQTVNTQEPFWVSNVVNGMPALKFDGTNDFLVTNPIYLPSNDYSYFTVFQKHGVKPVSARHVILGRAQSMSSLGNYFALTSSSTGQTTVIADAVNSKADASAATAFTTNFMRIVSVVRHDKTSAGTKIYVDGNYEGASSSSASKNAVEANGRVFIGGLGSDFGKIKASEFLLFDRALSDSERMKVEDYLALKYNLPADSDGDGMPDDWEKTYGLNPADPLDAALDPDGDGFSNLDEYLNGTDPRNFYNGIVPVITIKSGNNQSGLINTTLPIPLVVLITTNGAPYFNAPLTFSVISGGGLLGTNSVYSSSVVIRVGTNGLASANFRLGSSTANQIRVSGNSSSLTFNEQGILGTAATPTFSPDSTNELNQFSVTINCATPGATIRYTTNNTEPTETSQGINPGSSVLINQSLTLKAKAYNSNYYPSATKSAIYQVLTNTSQVYRDPLTKFTSFTRIPTNIQPVAVSNALWDGWIEKNPGFCITNVPAGTTNSSLAQLFANTQRTNFLARPTSEAKPDQTIMMEYIHRPGSYGVIWPRYHETVKGGYRLYVAPSGAGLETDLCTNNVLGKTNFVYFSGGVPALGTSLILSARAIYQGTGTTIIAKSWLKSDWQATPQRAPQAVMTNFFSGSILDDPHNPVAISASKAITNSPTIQNVWIHDESATAILPKYHSGTNHFVLAYLGSSTWVKNTTNVPTRIHYYLTNSYPSAIITTINGAVGGTTTSSFLPGQPDSNNLKASVQAASGKKILRMMIGSNDAKAGVSLSTWLSNMQTIINDARTWPVDDIILEEIGVRLDGGYTCYNLIKQYNDARNQLTGAKLGSAQTYDDQSQHLNFLSSDNVHQTDGGGDRLAQRQAAEIVIP